LRIISKKRAVFGFISRIFLCGLCLRRQYLIGQKLCGIPYRLESYVSRSELPSGAASEFFFGA